MKNINDYIEKTNTSKEDLMVEFHKNMKDEEFKNIANSINGKANTPQTKSVCVFLMLSFFILFSPD